MAKLKEMDAWGTIMRVARFILVMLLLSFSCSVFAQDMTEYVNRQDRFSMHGPGEPGVQRISYLSEYGVEFPANIYTYKDGPIHYSLTVVDYTDAERIHSERSNKTSADDGSLYWAVDVLASIAYAASNIRKRGGKITYDAWHYIQRVEGHQLQITNADESRTYAGIYLHESRLYIAEATVPETAPPPTFFQQSLTLLDDEGTEVHYNYIHSPRLRIGGG